MSDEEPEHFTCEADGHWWDLSEGCEYCEDDNCLVVCRDCGLEERACE